MSDEYDRAQLEELQRISDKMDEFAKLIVTLSNQQRQQRSVTESIGIVALGVVLGWFLIWLGAQALPEAIYWPVKFVVDG